jgi:nitrite reductase (NADH) large subunit
MSTSVAAGPSIDVLWRDPVWKQVSGFGLIALAVLGLLFSLRKRSSRFPWGSFSGWRFLHSAIGAASVAALGIHTGFHAGANLNRVLMFCFTGVLISGALAALITSLEHRLSATWGAALRRGWRAAHVFVFWPLPVLTFFHVLAFYYY